MSVRPSSSFRIDRYEYAKALLAEHASERSPGIVFDVGPEFCRMKPVVEELGYRWFGFDIAPKIPEVVKWDLVDPCPFTDTKADIVLLMDVVEHLFDPGIAMANIAQVMKPGGLLIVTVPNPHWSRARVHHLLFGTLASFTQRDLDYNHHVFTPFQHIIFRLLSDTGFEVQSYVTLDSAHAAWPKMRLSLSYPFIILESLGRRILELFDPSARGMSYALVARLKA